MESNKKIMRIISGKLKGKSIDFLKNSTTRPLKDSVKENIFNILKHSNLINVQIEKKNICTIPRSMPKNRFTDLITSLRTSLSTLFTSPNSI